ncbi:hypothetical protein PTKIN_Ptkin01aG0087600 [Pterospermum kingtungense]
MKPRKINKNSFKTRPFSMSCFPRVLSLLPVHLHATMTSPTGLRLPTLILPAASDQYHCKTLVRAR